MMSCLPFCRILYIIQTFYGQIQSNESRKLLSSLATFILFALCNKLSHNHREHVALPEYHYQGM